MKLEFITSPAKALNILRDGCYFIDRTLPVDERGISFSHPAGAGGASTGKEVGAKVICRWPGTIIEGAPPLNQDGYQGTEIAGMPGNLYLDTVRSRAFLPVGTNNQLKMYEIEFYDRAVLDAYVREKMAEEYSSLVSRLLFLKVTDEKVKRESERMIRVYKDIGERKFNLVF